MNKKLISKKTRKPRLTQVGRITRRSLAAFHLIMATACTIGIFAGKNPFAGLLLLYFFKTNFESAYSHIDRLWGGSGEKIDLLKEMWKDMKEELV